MDESMKELAQQIFQRNCNLTSLISKVSPTKRKELIENVHCLKHVIDKKDGAYFMLSNIITPVFSTLEPDLKDLLVDLGIELANSFPVMNLTEEEINKFKELVKQDYIKKMTVYQQDHNSLWYKTWILLTRFLQNYILTDRELANCMLRLIEKAFRSAQDRLVSYDCWKELIDVYSSNGTALSNPKHMRLIITPLHANLSTSEEVVSKRFEVWMHLIKCLKDKSAPCLHQFLNFSFGPLRENPLSDSIPVQSPGRRHPSLQKDITEFFMELLGHQGHSSSKDCIGDVKKFVLEVTVINSTIYEKIGENKGEDVFRAVCECCLLLQNWADENLQKKVTNCLWQSLISITEELQGVSAEKNTICTAAFLINLKIASLSSVFFETLLQTILEVVGRSNILINILMELSKKAIPAMGCKEVVHQLIDIGSKNKDPLQFFTDSYKIFEHHDNIQNNFVFDIWMKLASLLSPLTADVKKGRKTFFTDDVMKFLTWAAANLHHTTTEMSEVILKEWSSICKEICKLWKDYAITLTKQLNNVLKQDSKTASTITLMKNALEEVTKGISPQLDVERNCEASNPFLSLLHISKTSPSRLKGSQLNNSSPKQQKKPSNVVSSISKTPNSSNSSSEFVVINTPYKFDRSKLSDHQLEVLKRRREDIPSLYQDLTQDSQSNSYTNDLNLNHLTKKSSDACSGLKEKDVEKLQSTSLHQLTKINGRTKDNVREENESKEKESNLNNENNQDPPEVNQKLKAAVSYNIEDDNIKHRNEEVTPQKPARSKSTKRNRTKQQMEVKQLLNKSSLCKSDKSEIDEHGNNDALAGDRISAVDMLEEEKRKLRAQRELQKLNMDLRNANEYFVDKRTRRRSSYKVNTFCNKRRSSKASNSPDKDITHCESLEASRKDDIEATSEQNLSQSDDIIESSQESLVEVLPVVNNTALKVTEKSLDIDQEKENLTPYKESDTIYINNTKYKVVSSRPSNNTPLTDSEKLECCKDTETCNPDEPIEIEHVIKLDIPQKNKCLNDSDKEMCEKDTETPSFSSDEKDLPSSPVTGDTPTRNSELIHSTTNISPIKSPTSTTDGDQPEDCVTQDLFCSEEPTKCSTDKIEESTAEKPLEVTCTPKSNSRSAILVSLVAGNNSVLKMMSTSSKPKPFSRPPVAKTTRIMKMIENVDKTPCVTDEEKPLEMPCDDVYIPISAADVLIFERPVPSPLATPSSGSILKRKKPDCLDNITPCAKRKRVNFSDPPTTSEKFVLPHTEVSEEPTIKAEGIDELVIEENVSPDNVNTESNEEHKTDIDYIKNDADEIPAVVEEHKENSSEKVNVDLQSERTHHSVVTDNDSIVKDEAVMEVDPCTQVTDNVLSTEDDGTTSSRTALLEQVLSLDFHRTDDRDLLYSIGSHIVKTLPFSKLISLLLNKAETMDV